MKKAIAVLLTAAMCTAGLGTLVPASSADAVKTHYTYLDIVSMLTDTHRLALLPEEGEKSLEASSYARASQYNAATDQYINWSDNADNYGVISEVNDDRGPGYLVMDAQGPGAIVRSWSAQPESGGIDLYLDGELYSFSSFLDFLSAKGMFEGLDALCYRTAAQGYNNYVPITFNESCRIILREGWGAYYQFNYILFGEECSVERMPVQFNAEQKNALEKANDFFQNHLGENPLESSKRTEQAYTIFGGSSTTVFETPGQGALSEFRVKLTGFEDLTDQQVWDRVQELSVSMYWDGETDPSVFAPLGDFFGSPTGHASSMLTLGRDKEGWFYCYFVMPYADGARIVIENDGLYAAQLTVSTATIPLREPMERYARFHAKWNQNNGDGIRSDRFPDCTVVETQGTGRFVGMSLHVYEKGDYNWWGEGDEKFFVDGEAFPSWFGTGTEDYFGYAWGDRTEFSQAYHAQPFVENHDAYSGHITNARIHFADSIPFYTSFEGTLEKYLTEEMAEYGTTAYWYLSEDGRDPYGKLSFEERTDFYRKISSLRMEAEDLSYTCDSAGASVQNPVLGTETLPFGGSKYLLFDAKNAGDQLSLTIPLPSPYDGHLFIVGAKLDTGGRFDVLLDGETIGMLDCYNPVLCSGGNLDFGSFSLEAGEHQLTFVAREDTDKDSLGRSLALDSIVLNSGYPASATVLEGETLAVKSISNGVLATQLMTGWNTPGNEYSGGSQLWWRDFTDPATGAVAPPDALGPGETLQLYFDLSEDFEGALRLYMTQAGDYGIVDVSVDDIPLGTFDGCAAGVVRTCGLAADDIRLAKGRHVLKVEIVGKSGTHYLFGLDCLVLTPRQEATVREDNLVVEAENMTVLDVGGAEGCDLQPIPFTHGSGQLFWRGISGPGEELRLSFALSESYRGDLQVGVCMAADYGTFQFILDGDEIGSPVDTYQPVLLRADYISLGQVELSAGEHVLTVKNVGKNDLSAGYLLGLDAIRIYHGQPEPGCIEGEDLTVKIISGAGDFLTQDLPQYSQVVLDHAQNGSEFQFYLNLGKDIDTLEFTFTKASDYGKAALFIDDAVLDTIDFYSPTLTSKTYSYSGLDLKQGSHVLRLAVVEKNPDSSANLVGLDRIAYPCVLESLRIDQQPDATTFLQGQPLDLTGIRLIGIYDDGVVTRVEDFTVEGYDPKTAGEQTVTITYEGKTATFVVAVISPGDVDGDGEVDARDALNVLQHSVKLSELDAAAFEAADVTHDGRADANDALKILQYSVRLITSF